MTVPSVSGTAQTGSLYSDPTWDTRTGAAVKPGASTTSLTGDNSALSSDAFLKLLVAQLQYQDPSKPVDTASFMQETATLSQVQTSEANAKNNADMLASTRVQTAANLVGQTVSYTDGAGKLVTGKVASAAISGATPTLKIGTDTVDLASIQVVLGIGEAPTAPAA